jgi:hypothetical protein
MRILLKCPTRSRPQKVIQTLASYVKLANHPEQLGIAVSCDEDDDSMKRNLVQEELLRTLNPVAWKRIFFSENKSKIQACNANIHEIDWEWDIVVLVSDDMIPQLKGYDDVIRNHMMSRFPDTNGILWFNDGHQGDKLNTLCIYGRTMYDSFGYIYHPEYKSLFCDTELTDLCNTTLASKCLYVPYCIIRHEHPGTGYAQNMDALYDRNQKYWNEDMYTYIRRKTYAYDVSFLIPNIPGRDSSLARLTQSIHEKMRRLAPTLRYTIDLGFDNREMSIGMKRQRLIQESKAKYSAFIDDDDEITDEYIQDMRETIARSYPVMRLRGRIDPYTFTHSLENTLKGLMAVDTVFLRPPNHLNPMMTDVAKLIHFKDAFRGEDLEWTIRMSRSGFLTSEYKTDDSRIHYIYNMGERKVDPGSLIFQQNTSYETMLTMIWNANGAQAPPPPQPQPTRLRLTPRGFVSK